MEDFASAAARHWDNVVYLKQDCRWQEAAYLAGYVAECTFKALLERTTPMVLLRPLGHNLAALSGDALEMALVLNPAHERYHRAPVRAGTIGIGGWDPQHRYEQTGFLADAEFQRMVSEAETIGADLLSGLVLDGILQEVPQ
jgi:hypothetical protein